MGATGGRRGQRVVLGALLAIAGGWALVALAGGESDIPTPAPLQAGAESPAGTFGEGDGHAGGARPPVRTPSAAFGARDETISVLGCDDDAADEEADAAHLRGRVLDTEDSPVPGATVRVSRNAFRAREEHVAIADGEGRFRFDGLAPGWWRLEAEAEDMVAAPAPWPRLATDPAERRLIVRLARAARVSGTWSGVRDAPVAETTVPDEELLWQAAGIGAGIGAGGVGRRGPGPRVTGARLVDPDGAPGRWEVHLAPWEFGWGDREEPAIGRVGPDGRFELAGLAPGHWFLIPDDGSLRRLNAALQTTAVRTHRAWSDETRARVEELGGVEVVVGPGDDLELGLADPGPTTIVGRVLVDGVPAPGGHVVVCESAFLSCSMHWPVRAESACAPDGRYRIEGLTQGSVLILATHAGQAMPRARLLELAAGEVREVDFDFAGGQLEVELVDERGRPVAGLELGLSNDLDPRDPEGFGHVIAGFDPERHLFPPEPGVFLSHHDPPMPRRPTTDADGRARFEGLPAARYDLWIDDPHWILPALEPVAVGGAGSLTAQRIVLASGGVLEADVRWPGGAWDRKAELWVGLVDPDGVEHAPHRRRAYDRPPRFEAVPAGTWLLESYPDHGAEQPLTSVAVTIVAGETVHAEVPVGG